MHRAQEFMKKLNEKKIENLGVIYDFLVVLEKISSKRVV